MIGICSSRFSAPLRQRLVVRISNLRYLSAQEVSSSRESLIQALQQQLPQLEITTNPYELERHGKGESSHPTRRPDAVATPTSVEDIQEIIKYCVQHRIPIVPFGVGTSLEGHVACLSGGISLDMGKFTNIELPQMNGDSLPDPIATVGAGVTRKALNEALRHTGMQFSVDPGANATIGGMVATGASGTTAVRYGTMRENILQLECVLADNEATVVRTGTKALKNSAGYDLLGLMCGSEGTLGVITSVTVKLHPIPQHVVAAVCVFQTLKEAAQAVANLKLCEVPVVRCELLDAQSVAAFNLYNKKGPNMEVKPTLFLEFQGPTEDTLHGQIRMTESICDDYGGSNFQFTADDEERKALWAARHSLYYAVSKCILVISNLCLK
jgi:D-lactate dehydrogenase (cytochrome)